MKKILVYLTAVSLGLGLYQSGNSALADSDGNVTGNKGTSDPSPCDKKLTDKDSAFADQTLSAVQDLDFGKDSKVYLQNGKLVERPTKDDKFCEVAVVPHTTNQIRNGMSFKLSNLVSKFDTQHLVCSVPGAEFELFNRLCKHMKTKYGSDGWTGHHYHYAHSNDALMSPMDYTKDIVNHYNYELRLSDQSNRIKSLKCFNMDTYQDIHNALEGQKSDGVFSGFECPKAGINDFLNTKRKTGESSANSEAITRKEESKGNTIVAPSGGTNGPSGTKVDGAN